MTWGIAKSVENQWLSECDKACKDENFQTFRQLPYICHVTENKRNRELAQETWDAALLLMPRIMSVLPEISTRDKIGGPAKDCCINIKGYLISGSTSYSLLHLAQVECLLGPLKGLHIAEIGGGYGNMANLFFLLGEIESYTGFDLPGPSALQKKFTSCQGWNGNFPALGDIQRDNYDLSYSSCSLSELNQEGRKTYIEILKKSLMGFHVWNWINEDKSPEGVIDWFLTNVGVKPVYASSLPNSLTFQKTKNGFPWHPGLPMFVWGMK